MKWPIANAIAGATALVIGGWGAYTIHNLQGRVANLESDIRTVASQAEETKWLAEQALDVADQAKAKIEKRAEGSDETASDAQTEQATAPKSEDQSGATKSLKQTPTAQSRPGALKPSDPTLGPENAALSLIIYTDMECPYCKKLYDSGLIRKFVKRGNGQINATYRATPLRSHGEVAVREAMVADCARRLAGDDAYWQTVEAIFASTRGKGRGPQESLGRLTANATGIERPAIRECMNKPEIKKSVLKSRREAARSGVRQTPSVRVVNNRTGQSQLAGGNKPQKIYRMIESVVKQGGSAQRRPSGGGQQPSPTPSPGGGITPSTGLQP